MDATQTFTCLFCRREFRELPFYGCCGACYLTKPEVRALVEEVYPQTIREEVL